MSSTAGLQTGGVVAEFDQNGAGEQRLSEYEVWTIRDTI